jgi:GNAT superfamily N-acetyltransferase
MPPSPGTPPRAPVTVRPITPDDFDAVIALTRGVYPHDQPWQVEHLTAHRRVFPEGQLVAVDPATNTVLGYAASLVILWDDHEVHHNWDQLTASGTFANHDLTQGKTLYGADLMVDPAVRGRGIATTIYQARADLCRRLDLRRIRAGARLRGYHRFHNELTPEQYVHHVVRGDIIDPTLTFQLKRGFRVIAVCPGYLTADPESLGNAAVIEWVNPHAPKPASSDASNAALGNHPPCPPRRT